MKLNRRSVMLIALGLFSIFWLSVAMIFLGLVFFKYVAYLLGVACVSFVLVFSVLVMLGKIERD